MCFFALRLRNGASWTGSVELENRSCEINKEMALSNRELAHVILGNESAVGGVRPAEDINEVLCNGNWQRKSVAGGSYSANSLTEGKSNHFSALA